MITIIGMTMEVVYGAKLVRMLPHRQLLYERQSTMEGRGVTKESN